MKVICIIPSRYDSTRFPGKPLADLCGKPMIQHVYERVLMAETVSKAFVATDDERIFSAVQKFGGHAIMTSVTHRSGTDRIAEAVSGLDISDADIVVNIQGDQPLFEPSQIDEVARPLLDDPTIHLDFDAIDWLESYLHDWPGAALIISHDGVMVTAERLLKNKSLDKAEKTFKPLMGFVVYEDGKIEDLD